MRAWIEVFSYHPCNGYKHVALYMRAWIEVNLQNAKTSARGQVALYMRAWIEVFNTTGVIGGPCPSPST